MGGPNYITPPVNLHIMAMATISNNLTTIIVGNARHENAAQRKMQGWKMQEWTVRHKPAEG